ncbi:MAG TPA: hypothetical protein VIK14_01430 [Ignavibacteria bacterium]
MAENEITKDMIAITLSKGTPFIGHSSGAVSYSLKDAFAGGKSILVGQNPFAGKITTVIKTSHKKLIKDYMKEIDVELNKSFINF